MGHCQMLLAVAGLNDEQIRRRTEQLSSGDWSAFPPSERLAYRFAHRITLEPAAVSDRDVHELADALGPERAVDLIWYGGWCNYMTRVADAFQLPLERENVFARPVARQSKAEPGRGR